MENAAKALIIAGAILIAILLITIAVLIINQGRNITNVSQQSMTSQEIQTFNAQFTPYEGYKKGSELRGLENLVYASNSAHDDQHQVVFDPEEIDFSAFESTKTYEVTLIYADSDNVDDYASSVGCICVISISDAPTL